MGKLISTNPANSEVVGEIEVSTDDEIKQNVAAANKARLGWKELGIDARVKLLRPILDDFKNRKDEIAELITKETGKPLSQAIDETTEAFNDFGWYLDNVSKALAVEVTHKDERSTNRVIYEPFGVAAVITPWNYPFELAIWGIVPNLLVGNTVVFKISEECAIMGKLVEDVFSSHGLPEGVFSVLHGAGDVGEKLVNEEIHLIWFTGSSKVGQKLYKIAADKFIKAVLEMGGSSPCIVFEDADLEKAIPKIYDRRFNNCGQVCTAIKRLLVHESVFNEVVEGMKKEAEKRGVGDPADRATYIGSLVAKRQLVLLEEQVKDAIEKGAKVITGGKQVTHLADKGVFYEPTILTNISKDMRVWKEEVFGPVLPVIQFKTEEEAVEMANDTPFGLGGRVFSADMDRARRVASRIEAGTVEINLGNRWNMNNPFGGYKLSGMGREHGAVGFRELCQIKVISEG